MKNDELDPMLKNAINDLIKFPPRHPQVAARGRENFLKQAAVFRQAVSGEADLRHNRGISTIFPLFQRKERFPMFKTLIAVVLSVMVLFAVPGVTVAAAQGSLPDQALYPLKTWSEDAYLSITESSQTRVQVLLDFSDRRVVEMTRLLAAGHFIPETVQTRLQNELDMLLELAAGMDDVQAQKQLMIIVQRAETQLQTMTMLLSGAPDTAAPLLSRAHARLQQQVQLAAMGESDMPGFRMQVRQRFQSGGGSGTPMPGPDGNRQGSTQMSPTNMPGPSGSGSGNGYGPGSGMHQSTPVPGSTQLPGMPGSTQPSGMPGMKGSCTPSPDCTPQPGSGTGRMP
jgi:hypothetical protein